MEPNLSDGLERPEISNDAAAGADKVSTFTGNAEIEATVNRNDIFDGAFLHPKVAPTSPIRKYAAVFLAIGLSLSVVLFGIGVFVRLTYQAKDAHGRTVEDLRQEISELDTEVESLKAKDYTIFENSGFSTAFYTSSSQRTEAELERTDLQRMLDEALATNASRNIFNTGAVCYFLAGMIVLLVSISLFSVGRRKPKGASIVID